MKLRMTNKSIGGYISQIEFNNGKKVDISEDDIVIFVGPNNAGKSQALRDIHSLSMEKTQSVVVSNLVISKPECPISDELSKMFVGENKGNYVSYSFMGHYYSVYDYTDSSYQTQNYFAEFRDLFVANLNTEARLTICNPPRIINRNEPKLHPIHYAAFDSNYRKWLSNNFKKAFNIEITPNTSFGATIPLCIGVPVHLNGEYEDEQSRQEEYAKILEKYRQVQNQGDGVKSFTGILLYLMLNNYCTFLIDEPESFLHPPQARIMGQIIGETLSNRQAFISTHSEEIIKGLLDVCSDRIKIIRITREEDENDFSILSNSEFEQIWNDPILKYSNIMASLFHKSVVLCESDADCKMYSIIENHIKQSENKYSETLFIHCGGKYRMAKIIAALRSLNINVKVIADMDVLDDRSVFKGIAESLGVNFDVISNYYTNVVSNLPYPNHSKSREAVRNEINRILDGSTEVDLNNDEIKNIKKEASTITKWKNVKAQGIEAIPDGVAKTSFSELNQSLMKNGLFIVPVGELECFVKDVGNHGPAWVNGVLEKYPNLDDSVYKRIIDFITSMDL